MWCRTLFCSGTCWLIACLNRIDLFCGINTIPISLQLYLRGFISWSWRPFFLLFFNNTIDITFQTKLLVASTHCCCIEQCHTDTWTNRTSSESSVCYFTSSEVAVCVSYPNTARPHSWISKGLQKKKIKEEEERNLLPSGHIKNKTQQDTFLLLLGLLSGLDHVDHVHYRNNSTKSQHLWTFDLLIFFIFALNCWWNKKIT